ncbi:MAG: hypothetical protein HY665_08115 [Chloroflexi bacterium]|nr:hypothetical protein [Chloroflexota bacterium]
MRSLTATLLAAQKAASHIPHVKVEAKNKIHGAVRLDWERLYTGTEDDYFHALTMPGDGSMVRVRITPPADGRKLYRQRVASPGPSSDFSTWTYTSQYNCVVAAAASLGAEVSIFWINSSQEIRRFKSTDYGVSWGSPELIDYSPTTAIYGLAAAYKPNGDLAIFFADQSTLYVKKCAGGSWQSKAAWDKTTGDLSGVAVVYSADWNLFVTGKDSSGNFKLWSLIHGDGGDVASGTWSELKEFASAPSDGDFEYGQAFMDKPDVYRCFYIEKFGGTAAYNRPFWSHSIPGSRFLDNLWREQVPFNLSSQYGLAMAHYGDYCWLSTPSGVWRASLAETSVDLTADVLSLKQDTDEGQGRLTIELRNDDGRYASLPAPLDIGCQIDFSPGYVTTVGNEVSAGQTFALEAYEHTSSGGKASLFLYALDGWAAIKAWNARHQFRWNKASSEKSVKQILEFVLARAGLRLQVQSESSVITGYYPDFAIHPGDSGDTIIKRLLSFVPDVLFIEGNKAYLVNPQSTDSSTYSYGQAHVIFDGKYRKGAWSLNRVQVEGYDPSGGQPVIASSFSWSQIAKLYDRLKQLEDRNIDSATRAEQRGDAYLRKAELESVISSIRIPVNCGQQLYDVIDVTDSRAGLSAEKRRVLAISLVYSSRRGEYEQRLLLGMA